MDFPPEGTTAYTSTSDDLGKALKIILYILIGGVCFLASFVAYLYVFILPPAPNYISEQTTYAIPIDTEDFSQPIEKFTVDKEEIALSSVDTTSMEVNVNDAIIYPFGYLSTDGKNWRRVSLTGEETEEQWIIGETSFSISLSLGDFEINQFPYRSEIHLIIYSCSRSVIGHWDCHDGWQIKSFNTTIVKGTETTEEDACGGCPRGYTCFLEKCTKASIVGNKKNVEAGESLLVYAEEDYIITVTGISGDAKTATLKVNGKEVTVDISSGDAYIRDGDLRFVVTDIEPFSLNQNGAVELVVLSDYDKIEYCEDCVYTPPATYVPSSSSSGSKRRSSVSSCTPKCSEKVCGSDSCVGTCGPGCEDGDVCNDQGQCVEEECIADISCTDETCTGFLCTDDCENVHTGVLQPDCTDPDTGQTIIVCGDSPNGCGLCPNTCDPVNEHCDTENKICLPGPCQTYNGCSDAPTICVGTTCDDGCGNPCPGELTPDCTSRVCGLSPNRCGSCGTCGAHSSCDAAGVCSCDSGYADCNGDGTGSDADGCECSTGVCYPAGTCCTPDTCQDLGYQCDDHTEETCGSTISCGDCSNVGSNYVCKGILCLPPPPS